MVQIAPQDGATVSGTVGVYSALTGSRTVNGAARTAAMSRIGQQARYSFNAPAGQSITLGLTGVSAEDRIGNQAPLSYQGVRTGNSAVVLGCSYTFDTAVSAAFTVPATTGYTVILNSGDCASSNNSYTATATARLTQ